MLFKLIFSIFLLNENPPVKNGVTLSEENVVESNASLNQDQDNQVFLAAIDDDGQNYHIEEILKVFEKENAIDIKPAFFPNIAIKLETQFAPGISTSKVLVYEILEFLLNRGYQKSQITLFDREKSGLVSSGFLTSSGKSNLFKGFRVMDSSEDDYYREDWFHDSPLPPTAFDRAKFLLKYPKNPVARLQKERKSFLPAVLLENTYWINLAVPMDDPFLGINGAAANITLGGMSNFGRFMNKKTLSPATVTEVLAIPEIWENKLFSIIDFSNFQVANGQQFDSRYSASQNAIFIGKNPIVLDYFAWKIIGKERMFNHGLSSRKHENALLFKYAKELGLGKPADFHAKRIR